MKRKERRVEQRWGRVFYKFCLSALFIVLSIGLCLGISPVAHAQLSAMSFDGKDDFAYFVPSFTGSFDKLTLQVWVKPGTFDPASETFAAWIRGVDQLPPAEWIYKKARYSKFLLYQNKSD